MNRRYAHDRAAVTLTGGDDRDLSPCARYELDRRANRPDEKSPYDVLIDVTSGPDFHQAVREARSLCGSCPLAASCLRDNRDEPWAQAVMHQTKREASAAQAEYQRRRASKRAEANAARLADLRAMIADGADVAEACRRLGLSRDTLWTWCRRNAPEEFAALNASSPYGNQHRTVAPLTRRRKSRAKAEVAA